MAIADDQIAQLKHAYQVLGVPLSASAPFIKRTYRGLVKRWHPDLYRPADQDYAEATQMTQLINAAYLSIQSAPLRYHIDACPPSYARIRQAAHPPPNQPSHTRVESILKTGWFEFWIRFVFGAVFGAVMSFGSLVGHYDTYGMSENGFILVTIGSVLVFGFLAAIGGDDFWHSFFRRWWFWF